MYIYCIYKYTCIFLKYILFPQTKKHSHLHMTNKNHVVYWPNMKGRFSEKAHKTPSSLNQLPPWVPPSPNKCHTWGGWGSNGGWMGIGIVSPVTFKTCIFFCQKNFLGEMIDLQFDDHIFQMGWFNHQLVYNLCMYICMIHLVWYDMLWFDMIW